MAIEFTEKQKKVLNARNHNVLVSAAAGSGKTAVLVERIVRMISEGEHPLDIDRLLVVTFTRAAAAPVPFPQALRRILETAICGGRRPSFTMRRSRPATASAPFFFGTTSVKLIWIPAFVRWMIRRMCF